MVNKNFAKQLLYRSWFYFRQGQGIYIGYATSLLSFVGVFWLIIRDKPLGPFSFLNSSFIVFTIFLVVILAPLGVAVGYLHMKRSGAYSADAIVAAEANPLSYRAIPGKEQEAWAPAFLFLLQSSRISAEKAGILSPELREAMLETEKKIKVLISGKPISDMRRMQ